MTRPLALLLLLPSLACCPPPHNHAQLVMAPPQNHVMPDLPDLDTLARKERDDLLDQLAREVIAPYVEVRNSDGSGGSGVVIEVGGRIVILTAWHVVDGVETENISVLKKSGADVRKWLVVAVREDPDLDLAILELDDASGLVPARLGRPETARQGAGAWYIGTLAGRHGMLERSIISSTDTEHEGRREWIVVNGAGWHGNSGGAVYVNDGVSWVVVGIVQQGTHQPKAQVLCRNAACIHRFLGLVYS